jgi:phospholipid/cholesterol/gamma-HCH transport system substrate-binding protein
MRGLAAPLIKLGIFTLITVLSVLLLLAGVQNTYFASTSDYKARFTDASGLIPGSDVRIAGVRVGQVSDVQVADRNQAEVTFSVDEGRKIPSASIFAIKYLDISRGSGPIGATLAPDSVVPTSQTKPPLDLTTVFNGFKPLFVALSPNDINQLSYEIITVLQGESGNVGNLLARTASLTSTIADRDQVIGSLINNLNSVLDTVNARDENLSGLIISLQQLVSGLAADRTAIGSTLGPIADLTATTASFLDDARPPLRDDIIKIGQEASILNDNRGLIENFLRYTPQKANNIGRAGTYGSWFNFYLCSLGITFSGFPVQLPPLDLPFDSAGRCQAGPDRLAPGNETQGANNGFTPQPSPVVAGGYTGAQGARTGGGR